MSDNKGKSWDEVVEEIAKGVYLEMQNGPIKRKSKKELKDKAEEYKNKSNNNGIRYINDDKLVRNPRKVMAKITKEELWDLMIENADKSFTEMRKEHGDNSSRENPNFKTDNKKIVVEFALVKINIDIHHINVDDENLTYELDDSFGDDIVGTPLLGLQEIDGYTFFGFEIGGDWEYPIFGIIYYDGKNLRGYYPSCGNMINLDFKCAFGSEEEYESEEYEEDEYFDLDLSEIYYSKYNLISDNCGYNWELIEKDIKSMFVLR